MLILYPKEIRQALASPDFRKSKWKILKILKK